jgi:hypothetical protein
LLKTPDRIEQAMTVCCSFSWRKVQLAAGIACRRLVVISIQLANNIPTLAHSYAALHGLYEAVQTSAAPPIKSVVASGK